MAQLTFPTAPGAQVNISAVVGGSANSSPNAGAFVVGFADRGPVVPTQVLDLLDYTSKFGGRNSAAAVLSDSVETIFGEGGSTVWVGRVTGPTPVYGQLQLVDRNGSPQNTMLVKAAWYGSQSSQLSIGIVAGTVPNSFDLLVYDAASVTPTVPVESWRDNTSVANAVAAINASSSYITATDNASSSSGTAAFPALASGISTNILSAGTDDRANATDTTWGNAINVFGASLGGGLLLAPGRYTSSIHLLLETAAVAQVRFALLDTAPNPAASDITSLALLDSVGTGYTDPGDSAMLVGGWWNIPPAPGGSVVRQVPGSAVMAGRIARTDAAAGHSNQASLGFFGSSQYATSLVTPGFIESDRVAINGRQGTTGGVIARQVPGSPPMFYGFRTVSTAVRSYFAANIRETIALKRAIFNIGDSYVGRMIDGQGFVFQDLANDIGLVLLTAYQQNALWGATSDLAFGVDVGPTVNTPTTIAAGIIKARVWFVPSPTGERVIIDLVRSPIPAS